MKKILIPILFLLILIAPKNVFAGTSSSCPTPAGIGKCPDAIPDFYYNATYPDGACQVRVDCVATNFNCATGTCFGPTPPPPTYACPVGTADWAQPDVNLSTQNCCTAGQVPAWNDTDQKWECKQILSLWKLVGGTGPDIYYDEGNVGIGNTSPDGLLDIKGSAADRRLKIGYSGNDPHHIVSYRDMVFDSNAGFYFRDNPTAGDSKTYTDLVYIDRSGKVGIGTTSPEAQLDIGTTTDTWTDSSWGKAIEIPNASVIKWETNCPTCKDEDSWGIGQSTDGVYFVRDYVHLVDKIRKASYPLFITNAGNVGIGTTIPGAKLDVKVSGSVQTKITPNETYIWDYGPGYGVVATSDIGVHAYTATMDSTAVYAEKGTSAKFSLLAKGKVKIVNDSTSDVPFEIIGDGAQTGTGPIWFGYNSAAIQLTDYDNSKKWQITNRGSADADNRNKLMINGYDGSSWFTAMTIDTAGNVGIGTKSPASKLYVSGGAYTSADYDGSANQSAYAFGAKSIAAETSIYSYNAICTANYNGDCSGAGGVVIGSSNTDATVNITNTGYSKFGSITLDGSAGSIYVPAVANIQDMYIDGEIHAIPNTWGEGSAIKGVTGSGCAWSATFSEEGTGTGYCAQGKFVAGIKCTGGNCDNLQLWCCSL